MSWLQRLMEKVSNALTFEEKKPEQETAFPKFDRTHAEDIDDLCMGDTDVFEDKPQEKPKKKTKKTKNKKKRAEKKFNDEHEII